MHREAINRISAVAPVVMSLAAFALVLIVVSTGWERGLRDEGAAAHVFQLLIAAQIPVLLAFFTTANWGRIARVARPAALQAAALLLALGSVAYFKL